MSQKKSATPQLFLLEPKYTSMQTYMPKKRNPHTFFPATRVHNTRPPLYSLLWATYNKTHTGYSKNNVSEASWTHTATPCPSKPLQKKGQCKCPNTLMCDLANCCGSFKYLKVKPLLNLLYHLDVQRDLHITSTASLTATIQCINKSQLLRYFACQSCPIQAVAMPFIPRIPGLCGEHNC